MVVNELCDICILHLMWKVERDDHLHRSMNAQNRPSIPESQRKNGFARHENEKRVQT